MPLNDWWERARAWWYSNAGGVTQAYGPTQFAGEPALFGYRHYHEGVDLGFRYGQSVDNVVPYGRVVKITRETDRDTGGYGNSVIVATGRGVRVLYGHLSQIAVSEGQGVAVGDRIGSIGSTGHSTGPHLHLEARDERGRLIPLPGGTLSEVWRDLTNLFGAERPYTGQTNPGPPGEIGGWWSSRSQSGPGGLPTGVNTTAGGIGAGYTAPPAPDPAPGGGSGTGAGNAADPCGPMPALTDPVALANWASCKIAEAANGAAAGVAGGIPSINLDPGQAVGEFVVGHGAEFVIGGLGLILLIAGLRSLTNEPPVKVVTSPVVGAAGAALAVPKVAVKVAAKVAK